jgi:transposase
MSSSASSPPPRLIGDELWALVEPLIPPRPPAVHGRTGRPRVSDRDVLEGIAFVLSTGIGWSKLPSELGYGSGWTCWRRMHEWADAGVFDRLHQAVLDRLAEQGELDWSRAALDSVSVRAKRGGALTGSDPPDRGKAGSTYHLLVDAHGLPPNVLVSAANRHDSLFVEPARAPLPAPPRHHRPHRPDRCRASQRLGRHRWVVERTLGWLLSYKRLALRYDRTALTITALARLAVTLICARRLSTD